jgi:ribosomal protein S12 methylthiotransferase
MSAKKRSQTDSASKGTYAFVSLGCPKNTVDSERMLGLLQIDGYDLVSDPDGADFVVVNTCGFIERARAESFSAIDEMLSLKEQGRTRGVIVSGCLAERQKEQLLEDRPGIDHLVGVFGREEITRVADRLVGHLDEQRTVFRPAPIRALSDRDRLRITPKHFAYLKISEGCDRLCTFCAIPKMRGKHASKPIEEVVAEAEQLAADGVRELIVVAQDTTYYGFDIYGKPRLADLLVRLEEVVGIDWIRLMYFYPMYIDDELINAIAESRKIVPYIDIPLQHASESVLKRMKRPTGKGNLLGLVERMREKVPGLTLRTSFIVGFPGETEDDFAELVSFVEAGQFDNVGVFTFSDEEGTTSFDLPDRVPQKIKEARKRKLMAAQKKISRRRNRRRVGERLEVLVEGPHPETELLLQGRWAGQAPEIDGSVLIADGSAEPGAFVACEITEAHDYDLVARIL